MDSQLFLYHTIPGRVLLKFLTQPILSKIIGCFLDTPCSGILIKPFVKQNRIDLSDYETDGVRSFNDFFIRRIKPGLRPVDFDPEHLIAPCDSLLRVYPIRDGLVMNIKEAPYTTASLLRDPALAKRYDGGYCFVFRLCVDHYHRYCYADSGRKSRNVHLKGILHTVRPAALMTLPVFTENSREFTLIRTAHFGTILQMEVGAMLVGKICNYLQKGIVRRGEEKGYFKYGGSTVILLVPKDRVQVDPDLLEASAAGEETPVQLGSKIGTACISKT